MSRIADKPGTFKIRQHDDGSYVLSGVRSDGRRTKVPGLTKDEANELASKIWPRIGSADVPANVGPNAVSPTVFDDWGVPIRVSDSTVRSVAAAVGIKPDPAQTTIPKPVDKEAEAKAQLKKTEREKHAKSLMELAGVGYAAGDVFLARRLTSWMGKEPVNVSTKQVNNLADVAKDTFTDWFGDRELKPWQLMLMYTLGIPLAMLLQSPARKKDQSHLKAVP